MNCRPVEQVNPFQVPRPLIARRKRKAEAEAEAAPRPPVFLTAEEYDLYSIQGDYHESGLYWDVEKRHHGLTTPAVARAPVHGGSSAAAPDQQPTKHLALLLAECVGQRRVSFTGTKCDVDNARRRLSALAIHEHERYLELQRKIVQAQRRGLPRVLALSADQATQWQQLEAVVRVEQMDFCKMMERVLGEETSTQQSAVPSFVTSWYDAMLMQCRNDVYRLYPRHFEPSLTLALPSVAPDASSTTTPVKRAQEVAARGACCVVDAAALRPGQPLHGDDAEDADEDALGLVVATPRLAISADPRAEQLMEQYDCDLAVSSSTLVALFDSDTSTRFAHVPNDWVIPIKSRVVVRPGARGQAATSKKQIYLDRPLPGARPTAREKIAEAGRAALLSRFEKDAAVAESTGGRTVYHVWELADKRVLVRSTTHAWMASSASKSESSAKQQRAAANGTAALQEPKLLPLSVFVKPDYRLLGVEEQLTTSERSRFWLHSWLRGSSVVLVARFNPQTGLVDAWEKHSLSSLVYGDDSHPPLECFDPMAKFHWVSELFSTVADIPAGNYLLRSREEYVNETSSRVLEILMATAAQTAQSVEAEEVPTVLDLYDFVGGGTAADQEAAPLPSMFVLPTWNLDQRIPYTYRTGTYCQHFFLDGVCPLLDGAAGCPHAHLRFSERMSAAAGKPLPAGRWRFEDYDKLLKKAARSSFGAGKSKPFDVVPHFPLCADARTQQPLGATSASLHVRPRCPKPVGVCKLPHLTLHEVLERLGDARKRETRVKRRKHKEAYRHRRQAQWPTTDKPQEASAQ